MTPRFSLITAISGAALVLAVPAAWGDSWFADQQAGVRVSPDLVDRAVAAEQARLSNILPDLNDRAESRYQATQVFPDLDDRAEGRWPALDQNNQTVSMLDQREQAFGAKREAQLTSGQYPDVIERAVTAKGPARTYVGDDRFRIEPTNVPVQVSAPSSGSELDWSQLGIGFGMGILLALGLFLAVRLTRIRPLAH